MAIYELDGQAPDLPADGNYFIAETATVIGRVRLKPGASVWFGLATVSTPTMRPLASRKGAATCMTVEFGSFGSLRVERAPYLPRRVR